MALRRRIEPEYEAREEADGEAGWHALLTDPTLQAVVGTSSLLASDGRALLERIRDSKVARVNGVRVMILSTRDQAPTLDVVVTTTSGSDELTRLLVGAAGGSDATLSPPEERTRPQPLQRAAAPVTAALASRLPVLRVVETVTERGCEVQVAEPDTSPSPLSAVAQAPQAAAAAPSLAARRVPPPRGPASNPTPPQAASAGARPPTAASALTTPQESRMSRVESLNKVLKSLQSDSPGIEACALISEDGLLIASALPQDLDETRVGGMSATLVNLGTRAATELRRGEVREVIVRGEAGCAVMIHAGRGTVLLALATESTPLGLIFFDMRETLKSIRDIL